MKGVLPTNSHKFHTSWPGFVLVVFLNDVAEFRAFRLEIAGRRYEDFVLL